VDACKVFTKEIAETVVGPVSKAANTRGSGYGASSCTYMGQDSSVVSLVIRSGTSGSIFDQAFQASKGLSGVDPVKVDGLGDSAYWAGGNLKQMNILKGDNWMIVSMMGAKGDVQSKAKDVSEKILANM
jgi:hypothetical protein